MAKWLSREKKRALILKIFPYIGYLILKTLFLSCKKRFKIEEELPDEPIIVTMWHGELLMQPFLYKYLRKERNIALAISNHFDGELLAKIQSYFGFKTIRGSSTKGRLKLLKLMLNSIDNGYDIGITPDGPTGPRHSVADGTILVAKKKRVKIVCFNYKASSFWQLNSWDRFIIPKPFSTITFYSSSLLDVSNLPKDEANTLLKEKLLENANK